MTAEQIAADPGRWLAERRADKSGRPRVSASEIASIFRVEGAYEQPIETYWRKVLGVGLPDSRRFAYGKWLEEWAARIYTEDYEPGAVLEPGPLACHPQRRWQIASLDLLEHNPALPGVRPVEVKGVHDWHGWGEPPYGEIPPRFQAQCLWQGDVTGADEVRLLAIHRDTGEPRCYWLDMDDRAQKDLELMRDAATEFRDRITGHRPPPVTYSAGARDLLAAVYSPAVAEAVIIPARLGVRLQSARARLARATARFGQAELEVRERLRTGDRAIGADGTVYATRSVRQGHHLSARQVRERYPEVWAECWVENDRPTDTLRVKNWRNDDQD
jgi:hypothetical protein